MAKVSFTSLTPIKGIEDKSVMVGDKNIVIKQYLPIKDKADLVTYIIQSAFDENGLFSPVRLAVYKTIGLLQWYTNIGFTNTMLLNIEKTYDSIIINHLDTLIQEIDTSEYDCISNMITDAIIETKDYARSFAGQLRYVKEDYDETNLDLDKVMGQLQDQGQFDILKNVLTKMG